MTLFFQVVAEWLSMAKDFMTVAAAAAAIYVGFSGLRAWRKQLVGKTDYELARRLLRATYKVRDGIKGVRRPLITDEERDEAFKKAYPLLYEKRNVSPPAAQREYADKREAALYMQRWERFQQECLSDFYAELLEAEVSWSGAASSLGKSIDGCLKKLIIAIQQHVRQFSEGAPRLDAKAADAVERIIWGGGDTPEDDKFAMEVNAAVKQIEDFLRPYLK